MVMRTTSRTFPTVEEERRYRLRRAQLLNTPKEFSGAEYNRIFVPGTPVEEDIKIKFTPQDDETFKISEITPEGIEFTDFAWDEAGLNTGYSVIMPDKTTYTKAQWETKQTELGIQQAEWETKQVEAEKTIARLFPEGGFVPLPKEKAGGVTTGLSYIPGAIHVKTLEDVGKLAEEHPEEFTRWLRGQAREDTQALLSYFGLGEEEIKGVLPIEIPEEGKRFLIDVPDETGGTWQKPAIVMPDYSVKAVDTGEQFATYNPQTGELEEYKKPDTRGAVGKLWSRLVAGAGSFQAGIGAVMKWVGSDAASYGGDTFVDEIMKGLTPLESLGQTTLEAGQTWQKNAPEGLGWQFVQMLPTQVFLMVVSAGVGGLVGGAVVGIGGKVAAPAVSRLAGMGVAGAKIAATATKLSPYTKYLLPTTGMGATSRSIESALEAGAAYEQGLVRGMTKEEASDAASEVFNSNMQLIGSNIR